MLRTVYGEDQVIVPWVCEKLKIIDPFPCVTIGVARNDELVAAALYNNMQMNLAGRPNSIEISFVTIDKRWASRAIIGHLLSYPFGQLRVKRAQSTVSKRNKHVRQFLERLGFKYEGTGRQAWPEGGDACVYSMLSGEYFSSPWNIKSGKISTFGPGSARPKCYIGGSDCIQ